MSSVGSIFGGTATGAGASGSAATSGLSAASRAAAALVVYSAARFGMGSRSAAREGYWLGSEITVADIGLFAQLHSLRSALTPWQREQVEARPALRAWLDRVDAATRS